MGERNAVELEDVDRERQSLVEDIQQIRRTLEIISNATHSESFDSSENFCDLSKDEAAERDSEDSDDELAIIKSPRYRESEDEEKLLNEQRFPSDVILTENVEAYNESLCENALSNIQIIQLDDKEHQLNEGDSYQIAKILPQQDGDNVELTLKPIKRNPQKSNGTRQGILNPVNSTYQARPNDFETLASYDYQNEYTLTELQPANNDTNCVNAESNGICWSPGYDTNFPLTHSNWQQSGNVDTEPQFTARTQQEYSNNSNVQNSLWGNLRPSNAGVEYVEEQTDVHRCLNLNRRYQTIIEEELRRIERSLLENRELQLGLTHMTQSAITKAEAMAFRQLTFFSKPYFKDKSKQSPLDNEDVKARKAVGQPSPFERAPRPWSNEESDTLSDAVKAAVLEAKLMPLMQRVEVLTPRKSKTEEEQREMQELTAEIGRIKGLPLPTLVQNFTLPIDWEDIADKVLPHRTPFQCQIYWYNELHPFLNKGTWAKNEDKQLLELVNENHQTDWDKIARELMKRYYLMKDLLQTNLHLLRLNSDRQETTNRSAVQCLRRYQKNLNKNFLKSKWEEDEDRRLVEAVKICGLGAWERVASLLEGRTGAQCMHRYMKSANPGIKKGKWDENEDNILRKAVERFGSNWAKIRSYMIPHRTDSQIRERWSDVLDPTINKNPWTEKEDKMLLKIVEEQGAGNWTKVASKMKGRNDNRCCRRWKYLIKLESEGSLPSENPLAKMVKSSQPQGNATKRLQPLTETLRSSKVTATTIPSSDKQEKAPTTASLNIKQVSAQPDAANLLEKSRKTKRDDVLKSGPSPSHQEVPMKKRTGPNPAVVAQASALPNALPMAYITQFSVLLQAFSVDVSGALKNVNKPVRQTAQSDSDCINVSTSERSCQVKNVADKSPSLQTQQSSLGGEDSNNHSVRINDTSLPQNPENSKTTGVMNQRTTENCVLEKQVSEGESDTGINRSDGGTLTDGNGINKSDGSTPIDDTGINRSDGSTLADNGGNRSDGSTHYPDATNVELAGTMDWNTGATRAGQNEARGTNITKNQPKSRDVDGGTPAKDVIVIDEVSDCDKDTPRFLPQEVSLVKDGNIRDVSHEIIVDSGPDDIQQKESLEEPMQGKDKEDNPSAAGLGVLLSDSRHGLTHDIVLVPGATSIETVTEECSEVPMLHLRRRRSKRKQTVTSYNNKRKRTISREKPTKTESEMSNEITKLNGTQRNQGNMSNSTINNEDSEVNVLRKKKCAREECLGDKTRLRSRYPVRSNRTRRKGNTVFAPDVEEISKDPGEEHLAKKPHSSGRNPGDETCTAIPNGSSTTRVKAANVPPLPPSATTLNAFKKLLVLRKDLKNQADSLKLATGTRIVQGDGIQQKNSQKSLKRRKTSLEITNSNTNSVRRPHAELSVTYAGNTLGKKISDSLPYQQLVNRFKSLFLWPGFLSIVNPESVHKKGNQTSKNSTSPNKQSTSRKT